MTDTQTHGAPSARTPVSLPSVRADDPHLQPAARYPGRVEKLVALCFLVGMAGFIGFGVAYWQAAKPLWLAVSFGVGLFFLGFGLTAWGKYLMPQGPFVEERHRLAGTPEEQEAMAAALVERTGMVVQRRGLLGTLFAAGAAVFGVVLLFPVLRSLGPLPKSGGNPETSFETTNWRKGSYLVDSTGRRIKASEIVQGGIVTVFPEGYQATDIGMAVDQTVLIRWSTSPFTTRPGRETWTPEGFVAYSKLCTHLGCPVGLYEKQLGLLVCPCHQSMFNITDGAVPEFGPAPRPLPQLPLYIDSAGYLRAQGPYDQAVGPGFWERSTVSL